MDLDPTPRGVVGQVIDRPAYRSTKRLAIGVGEALARFAHDLDRGRFLTNGADLFSNDAAGRAQMREFAEIDERKAKRAQRMSKKKATKKKVTKKRAPAPKKKAARRT